MDSYEILKNVLMDIGQFEQLYVEKDGIIVMKRTVDAYVQQLKNELLVVE